MIRFGGIKQYPETLTPAEFNGKWTSAIFSSSNTFDQIGWDPADIEDNPLFPPQRGNFGQFAQGLNEEYGHIDFNIMKEIFLDWPTNLIDTWAIDFNDSFMLDFDVFYKALTMETAIHVTVYGITNVNWHDYQDSYQQALTMLKLSSNL